MLKRAIEKIVDITRPEIVSVDGISYLVTINGYQQIKPNIEFPATLKLYSLASLVAMVKTEADKRHSPPFYIQAASYDEVFCYTHPLPELCNERSLLYSVAAKDVPGWENDTPLPFEEALIAVRTRFENTPDTTYLLKLLSDITNGAKVTYTDNGIASTVVTSKGVALQGSETIRPIIMLKPYRTFQEIEQPGSEFHIRISERGIKFIEADGGMWKLVARRYIAGYLTSELEKLVAAGRVVVTI